MINVPSAKLVLFHKMIAGNIIMLGVTDSSTVTILLALFFSRSAASLSVAAAP